MKDRIFLLIETKNLTPGKFADEIGVERSTMSHIKSDRSKPSLDMAQKVLECYPEVSAEWLILGRGPMFKQTNDSRELDLFSHMGINSLKPDENEPEISVSTEPISHNNYKSDLAAPEIQGALQKNEVRDIPIASLKPDRVVDRVVIFYSDQTFEEFKK